MFVSWLLRLVVLVFNGYVVLMVREWKVLLVVFEIWWILYKLLLVRIGWEVLRCLCVLILCFSRLGCGLIYVSSDIINFFLIGLIGGFVI